MKIKQLKWIHRTVQGEKAEWYESDLLHYCIEPMRGAWTLWIDDEQVQDFDTIEEAKEVAQKHFEKRVRTYLV